ncbi:major facilitator superfamily MFS_1 [Desulfatibacillum aliphaticivorans]|uniref:Major facilitator superfamily MFS_1 n=1 Tax=Desulfatibacillum aliphaticivorans TaxID=218208 RepID=B8FM40_DESAL|nr:multidrug effflux MFS transporter [Desulfatibacillum aliphaticivorans]ACL05773.1 major facilitator superfamily MFS_1 [Desulfatibacillum aliphaticivorans]
MKRIVPLLAFLTAFPALSTDMYLPAIPMLVEQWNQPLVVVNLTLIAFFASFCTFIAVYGPLSDRYGRRPLLLAGITIYIGASIGCALSPSVYTLIAARIGQGAGAASAQTLALAIIRDKFDGLERGRILAHMVGIMAVAPMLGPVFGGWMLKWRHWPWLFVSQACLGVIGFIGVYFMEESLKDPIKVSALQVFARYGVVFKNGRFMKLNVLMSLFGLPFFGFIASSSYLYIKVFGLTEQQFGYFFAFTSGGFMLGPMVLNRLANHMSYNKIIGIGLSGVTLGGLALAFNSHATPWHLALPIFLFVFSFGVFRPAATNMALEQVTTDVGSASSMLVFLYSMVGAVGMWMISLEWPDKMTVLGSLAAGIGILSLIFWFLSSGNYEIGGELPLEAPAED